MEQYSDLDLIPTTLGLVVESGTTGLDVLTGGPCKGPCCDSSGDNYCPPSFVGDCEPEPEPSADAESAD